MQNLLASHLPLASHFHPDQHRTKSLGKRLYNWQRGIVQVNLTLPMTFGHQRFKINSLTGVVLGKKKDYSWTFWPIKVCACVLILKEGWNSRIWFKGRYEHGLKQLQMFLWSCDLWPVNFTTVVHLCVHYHHIRLSSSRDMSFISVFFASACISCITGAAFSFVFHPHFHPLSLPPFRKEHQDSLENSLLPHLSSPQLLVLSSNSIHASRIL